MGLWASLLGRSRSRRLARYERRVDEINRLEPELARQSDSALQAQSRSLVERAQVTSQPARLLVEAFALAREAARRVLNMRHYDVQLIGGMALHDGLVAEMKTGEGKTLVATLPTYLEALTGRGVHVVTVNDYLAQRDAEWMGALYRFLGLEVGVILEEMGVPEVQETGARRTAYSADITYGTNHEIVFDYLRDNLATDPDEIVQRGFNFALIDEVDFLLIDEARTPLIISGPSREDVGVFRRVDRIVRRLRRDEDYTVDARTRTVSLADPAFVKVERRLSVDNLADPRHVELYHALHQSLLAHGIYRKDVDYIVDRGRVFIVDEFTGRVSEDKRYADGLHQAIEAKEQVRVRTEDQTIAKVTYQTFFGRYAKLAGMTGTALSEQRELKETYGLEVTAVRTHQPMIRIDYEDALLLTRSQKHAAIVEEIADMRNQGRPVLVGTTHVRESEQLSARLRRASIKHAVLNAKNHRAEAAIIAQAGRPGAVTISTNMAGRGTDILLGGNAHMLAETQSGRRLDADAQRERCEQARIQVVEAGGLHVIGTSHHESVRVDNQLRGRAGRQGDPGSSQFIVSLDDEIWQTFGKREITRIRTELSESGHAPDAPIESPKIAGVLKSLQTKVDVENHAIRRDVLKYDLVVHAQREAIYGWRQTLVAGGGFDAESVVADVTHDQSLRYATTHEVDGALRGCLGIDLVIDPPDAPRPERARQAAVQAWTHLERHAASVDADRLFDVGRRLLLQAIDDLWSDHLSNLERLEQGIDLQSYAETDPIIAWQRAATEMWQALLAEIRLRAVTQWFRTMRSRQAPKPGT